MLPNEPLRRNDERPDADFYAVPRLVTHVDAAAVAAVTALYRHHLPAGGAILDLMASWVSHLPPEVAYARVAGLGMNAAELAANPRLTERVVQNLNERPVLPFDDAAFDGAAICVSVQYLTRPRAVFAELARVLHPGAALVITCSNRCFPSKATREWLARDPSGQAALVAGYLAAAGGFDAPAVEAHRPAPGGDPLVAVVARRATAGPTQPDPV